MHGLQSDIPSLFSCHFAFEETNISNTSTQALKMIPRPHSQTLSPANYEGTGTGTATATIVITNHKIGTQCIAPQRQVN